MIHRRQLLTGLIGIIAAPAIVRATSLMPIKSWLDDGIALRCVPHPSGPDWVEFTIRGVDAYGKKLTECVWVPMQDIEDRKPIATTRQDFAAIDGFEANGTIWAHFQNPKVGLDMDIIGGSL